ncbi:MAG: glycosyltransferase family 1 protein [Sphingomonas sp.]|uniref:glycosyltransferase family 4 protein n=1 Tax=Sphingomonas sp. TaxID=28214 RepID=UPI0025CC8AC3|nr:glycosyltransferase family 1 protein [Sphingomonas sp.]MBX3565187.1 glycosyltransferase family 1 protein [Sphingomonas sp.]
MKPSDIRVALFSGNYNYVRDGANQSLNKLVGHLLSRGVNVRVYSPTVEKPAFEPTGDLVSIPSWPLPGERGEFRFATHLPKSVHDDLAAFRPNVIHVSAPEFIGHAAIRYARKHGLPVVASMHTRFETYPRYYKLGFLEPLVIHLLTRFYNKVDAVVVPAQSSIDLLREWGVTTPIGIWARGVDHDTFSPKRRDLAWRRSLGIADDEFAVGFLGRLVKEKGLDIFSEVCRRLTAQGVPHRVLVVGEGPAREWFGELVPEAAFAGFQRGNDLGRAVASMDVLFNPSVTESFGNVTLEAMAAGVPVVAARATGAVDLIDEGETGFLVPPRDVQAYADRIAMLARDSTLYRAQSDAGHAKADGYVWDAINEKVIDTYFEVLERHAK